MKWDKAGDVQYKSVSEGTFYKIEDRVHFVYDVGGVLDRFYKLADEFLGNVNAIREDFTTFTTDDKGE